MEKKLLSQEALKVIACVTMLIDHIGAVFFPQHLWLRVIGRLSFPIYCFLLAEGAQYTKNPVKYGLRLFIGLLLSEIPYDLCFYGGFRVLHQSVMVTLFLAYLMLLCMKKAPLWAKPLIAVPFAFLAELLHGDYGGAGVLMVAVFAMARETEERMLLQALGLGVISLWLTFSGSVLQIFAIAALIPIALYSEKKSTASSALQWAFYLFYPVHLAVLWLISLL